MKISHTLNPVAKSHFELKHLTNFDQEGGILKVIMKVICLNGQIIKQIFFSEKLITDITLTNP